MAVCLGTAGCGLAPPPMPPVIVPEVEVCLPSSREVTDREDFTGQTEAVRTIDIRARVTGYLKAVHFRHGSEVKKGELLFEIDPPYYQAEADRAAGVVAEMEAKSDRMTLDYERAKKLLPARTIVKEQFDLVSGEMAQSVAQLRSAKAALKIAEVNLAYCEIRATIDGRLSRPNIDPGNLVKADDTVLTRIVSQNPIWVYFDLDERTMLRLRRLSPNSSIGDSAAGKMSVQMALVDEPTFFREGELDFEDNRLDPGTGTLRVRAVFDNSDGLLSAGLFVRIRLPIGAPHRSLLVPEQSLGTDQGQKFLYVLTADDQVTYRAVEVGKVHDRQRVINTGLEPDERVVVTGMQRVRPGIKVKPEMTDGAALSAADARSKAQAKQAN